MFSYHGISNRKQIKLKVQQFYLLWGNQCNEALAELFGLDYKLDVCVIDKNPYYSCGKPQKINVINKY